MTEPSHNIDSIRRRVQLALAFALLVSVTANVLAAEASIVGRCVAALAPIILLLTVDVVGRVPRSSGWLGFVRFAATSVVAVVAAVASYSHMYKVVLENGEPRFVALILPLAVDGLAVVCSGGLYELDRPKHSLAEEPVSTPVEDNSVEEPVSSPTPVQETPVDVVSSAQPPAVEPVVVRSPQTSTVRPLAPVLTK